MADQDYSSETVEKPEGLTKNGECVEAVCVAMEGTAVGADGGSGIEPDSDADTKAVADKKKWLQDVFKKKDSPTKKFSTEVEPGNALVSSRAKWLEEEKKDSPVKKTDVEIEAGNDLVSSRMKWLQEEANKAEDIPKRTCAPEVSGISAQDRARWLQEQAFQKPDEKEFEDASETQIGSDLVADRMKWLAEQGKGTEQDAKKTFDATEICGVNAQDRVRWLQEQAFRQAEEDNAKDSEETHVGNELVSDRMKWLAEESKRKEEMTKKSFDAAEISGVNAQDRARWLQEQAFRQAEEEKATDALETQIGSELVSDRMKWLAEQGKGKEEAMKKSFDAAEISGVSAHDRARWLQEQAFRQAEEDKVKDASKAQVGNELVSDRMKQLAEQAKGKEEGIKKSFDAKEISGVNAHDRARWLQEQAFREAKEDKAKDAAETHVGHELVSDRMKWLAEQGKGKEEVTKKSFDATEMSGVNAHDKARWLQEQAFRKAEEDKAKDTSEAHVGNELVSDRMKQLAEQAKGKEEEIKKSFDAKEISGVNAQDRARWLQEQAFCHSEEDEFEDAKENNVGNELVSDRMKWLREQAFKDSKDEATSSDAKKQTNISGVVKAFGGTAKKKTAVQRRKEELERQQKEMKKLANPHSHMKVSWRPQGGGPGQFKKTMTDKRGPAPKKSLKDLP